MAVGHNRKVQLLLGDLTDFPAEHAVDVLVVSAFPNDYSPTPRSLIGALSRRELSVAALSMRKSSIYANIFHAGYQAKYLRASQVWSFVGSFVLSPRRGAGRPNWSATYFKLWHRSLSQHRTYDLLQCLSSPPETKAIR